MGDAAPLAFDDLVARADHVLAGMNLDLRRPNDVGQQLGDVERARRERADRLVERRDVLAAHHRQPDGARRDRRRVRILQPEDHPLAGRRRRQSGITVRWPGIGVMGTRQHEVVFRRAVDVERVFDNVVAGGAGDVDEQLAGKLAKVEAFARPTAVNLAQAD